MVTDAGRAELLRRDDGDEVRVVEDGRAGALGEFAEGLVVAFAGVVFMMLVVNFATECLNVLQSKHEKKSSDIWSGD